MGLLDWVKDTYEDYVAKPAEEAKEAIVEKAEEGEAYIAQKAEEGKAYIAEKTEEVKEYVAEKVEEGETYVAQKFEDASNKIISVGTTVNTTMTAANVAADVAVQSTISLVRDESKIVKGLHTITDIGTLGASMTTKIEAAEAALSNGVKNVKTLTGASTVSSGKEILEHIVPIGKVGAAAGDIAIFAAPFSEFETSMKLVNKDDLDLIAQYTPENYNMAIAEATTIVVGDACSAGVIRSIAKTPTAIAHLVPGVSSDFGSSYDQMLDKNITIPKLYETVAKGYEKSIALIKETGLVVNDLPRNPHSKDLFNAYAKEVLNESGQEWTAETNKKIAENMLKNGVRPPRVEEALKHSPEPLESSYYFVKDIRNSSEKQQMQQSIGMRR